MDNREAEEIVTALGVEADKFGIDVLSDHEKNVLVPWWACGVIGYGGFRFFFQGSYSLTDVARRFRMLGFGKAAGACDNVLSTLFKDSAEPSDPEIRANLLSGVEWDVFDPQASIFFDVTFADLRAAIGAYIDTFPDAFARIRAAAREELRVLRERKS